ncbi:MAG TPA: rhomboid family intramembrane serine protease [Anaerolineaceae bacterium]|nr:rhomboid family intramembrane serine protease [Anaerolineaceae bacterium]HPN52688.1 rhomboid family intramembrane serine protease [Anaerolineaceae bacterium]
MENIEDTPKPLPPPQIRLPQARPLATYALLVITIGCFLLQLASEAFLKYDWLFIFGGKIDPFILQGEIWRFITPVFLHGSLMHIAFNMYALMQFGPDLERAFGTPRFLALYFLAALGGNALSFAFSDAYSLGSSTAVFGLIAAEGVYIITNRRLYGSKFGQLIANIAVVIGINLVIGFQPGSRIDNLGHIGGLLAGGLFTFISGPHLDLKGSYPVFTLYDDRSQGRIWLGGLLTFMLIFALIAIGFLIS